MDLSHYKSALALVFGTHIYVVAKHQFGLDAEVKEQKSMLIP
jgi:hypothetical protein